MFPLDYEKIITSNVSAIEDQLLALSFEIAKLKSIILTPDPLTPLAIHSKDLFTGRLQMFQLQIEKLNSLFQMTRQNMGQTDDIQRTQELIILIIEKIKMKCVSTPMEFINELPDFHDNKQSSCCLSVPANQDVPQEAPRAWTTQDVWSVDEPRNGVTQSDMTSQETQCYEGQQQQQQQGPIMASHQISEGHPSKNWTTCPNLCVNSSSPFEDLGFSEETLKLLSEV